MIRRLIALAAALMCLVSVPRALGDTPAADDTVNYEISSYVIYLTVRPDGDVRVREEYIYNNPSAYEGFVHAVDLSGTDGVEDVEVWTDARALSTEASPEEASYYQTALTDGELVINVLSPGDSDWRTFVFAYTLKGLARRSDETAMLKRVLVPAGRDALYQGATAIVTLPQSDGEILVWTEPALAEEQRIIRYDTISLGPVDLAADESLTFETLFPAQWLADAPLSSDLPAREALVAEHAAVEEVTEQQKSTFRAQQYISCAVYVALCLTALWLLKRRYGFRSSKKTSPEPHLARQVPVALAAFTRTGEADAAALSGTLRELEERGAVKLVHEDADSRLEILSEPEDLKAHQRAALAVLKSGEGVNRLSGISAGEDAEKARAFEGAYRAYRRAVADDARREGLVWHNEQQLIAVNAACIMLGFMLMGMLLLIGKILLVEAVVIFVFMMVMLRLFSRIRSLTDRGEAVARSAAAEAAAFTPETDSLALAVALNVSDDKIEELMAWRRVTDAIQKAHLHNATLRKLHLSRRQVSGEP